jgi:serine/threonine protein kinase
VKLLGQGSFGKVFYVKKKDNGEVYAMKALNKRNLIKKRQLIYACREAKVMKKFDNPFILKLHFAF